MTDQPRISGVDMRGFRYAPEPLQRKREWELDAARAALARAIEALSRKTEEIDDLESRHGAHARDVSRNAGAAIDPTHHRENLNYLAGLRAVIAENERQREGLRQQRDVAQARCITLQRKLEALIQHRQRAASEYAFEEGNRQAALADQDWLMRTAGRRVIR